MIIVSAANKAFQEWADIQHSRSQKIGYKTLIYNVGGLEGTWPRFDVFSLEAKASANPKAFPCIWKPHVIRTAQRYIKHRDLCHHMVWMDADAFCLKEIDHVFTQDFDVAVTMRRQGEMPGSPHPMFDNYINSGVIFFKLTRATLEFIRAWEKITPYVETMSDQESLNRLLYPSVDFTQYGKTFNVNGAKVLLLKTDEYNWYYHDEPLPRTARVIHFKGAMPEKWKNYNKYIQSYGNKRI